jgi:hypothetical protein
MKIKRLDYFEAEIELNEKFIISYEDKSKLEKEIQEVIKKYRI